MAPSSRVSYREPDTDEDIPSSDDYDEDEHEDEEDGKHVHDEKGKDAEQNDEHSEDGGDKKEDDESGGEGSSTRPKRSRPFVHAMCDVVDIRIDNQKPGEIQYRMVDFLDSDDSNSDDEWTGDGAEANDYAW